MAIRRSHRRRELQDLCREGPRPHASSRRHRDHGQSRQSQSQGGTPAHSRGRCQALLPAEILTGPEPDRAGLRQDQALLAKGRRALRRNHLHRNRRNPRRIYTRRIRQLFSKFRLCVNLKASCSNRPCESPSSQREINHTGRLWLTMYDTRRTRFLGLSDDAQSALIAAARDATPVRGLTHGFYKYPARFSPIFAGAVIQAFTEPGDLVLDPHVGGGTTMVEALAAGRQAVGVDISTLAEFVSGVKCTVFSAAELDKLGWWAARVAASVDIHRTSVASAAYKDLGYYKHLDHPSRWRLRKAIDQSLVSAVKLGTPRLEAFGRCVVLKTAQWALDGRSKRTPEVSLLCTTSIARTALRATLNARDVAPELAFGVSCSTLSIS